MKCEVCDREALDKYCMVHEKAYFNLVQKFEAWKRATGFSWKEYLKEVVKNSYTGSWAKEVAGHLLKDKDG